MVYIRTEFGHWFIFLGKYNNLFVCRRFCRALRCPLYPSICFCDFGYVIGIITNWCPISLVNYSDSFTYWNSNGEFTINLQPVAYLGQRILFLLGYSISLVARPYCKMVTPRGKRKVSVDVKFYRNRSSYRLVNVWLHYRTIWMEVYLLRSNSNIWNLYSFATYLCI